MENYIKSISRISRHFQCSRTKSSTKDSIMFTPGHGVKGLTDVLRQWERAYNDLFSKAVSAIRQPIASFINWHIQKTDIQRTSTVRSTKGLIVHVFGRIDAGFINLIFNY